MSFRLPSSLCLTAAPLLIMLACAPLFAQNDGSQSLGDVARNLRRDKADQSNQQPNAEPPIIDNDNLAQAMEDAKKARPVAEDKTVFSIDSANKTIKVSSPDVTCSLSFNSRNSSLLIRPVLIEDLPLDELLKIDGPGSIQDDALQLEVFNGTDWELREITIGLTLERTAGENAEFVAKARIMPAAQIDAPAVVERRSDVTILYHLKAEAKPFSKASFNEKIGITPGPDEDWRWSIVEAKGIRPQQTPFLPDSLMDKFLGGATSSSTQSNLP